MDYYEIWFDLKDSRRDLDFAGALDRFMGHFREKGWIEGHRLTRRKLGFGPEALGEFHLTMEIKNLAKLDEAFQAAASRTGEIEQIHSQVYSQVTNLRFGLARDFPDPVRQTPEDESDGR